MSLGGEIANFVLVATHCVLSVWAQGLGLDFEKWFDIEATSSTGKAMAAVPLAFC